MVYWNVHLLAHTKSQPEGILSGASLYRMQYCTFNLIPWDRLEKHQLDFPLLNTLEYIRRP